MRILILTRMYTGLLESLRSGEWKPQGMPAYYKLVEALDKEDDVELEVACLGKATHDIGKREGFRFAGMKACFSVIPYKNISHIRFMDRALNDAAQFFYSTHMVRKNRYDLIYVDRVNIVFGALWAVLLKQNVIVRFFGVGTLIKRMSGAKRYLKEPFRYFSLRAPFKYIICSEDGTGSRHLFDRYARKDVPREILLNGIDRVEDVPRGNDFLRKKYNVPDGRKIILFLSRLSLDKGADLFVSSIERLQKMNPDFLAVVVGDGPLKNKLEEEVAAKVLKSHIKFEGQVAHADVRKYYCSADIYVSLNLLGNLCNTVLEAIGTGKCIVTFKVDSLDHTDDITEKLLSGSALFIDKRDIISELPEALDRLLGTESEMKRLSEAVLGVKKTMKSWKDRITYEVALLKKLGKG